MYQTSNYENTPQWIKPYTPSNSTLVYCTITLQIPITQNKNDIDVFNLGWDTL